MLQYLFDTSAFAKRYHREIGSSAVDEIFITPDATFCLSRLGVLESESAIARKVRTREISVDLARALQAWISEDVDRGAIIVVKVAPIHYSIASALLSKYAFRRGLKTLDALQLAVALDLRAEGLLDVFVLADRTLAEIAMAEQIPIQTV